MKSPDASSQPEFFELLEALCEDRLTPVDVQRLEQLVLSSTAARRTYLAYVDLHGTLHWNAAYGADGENFDPAVSGRTSDDDSKNEERKTFRRRPLGLWITAAAVALVGVLSFALGRLFPPDGAGQPVASLGQNRPPAPNDRQIPAVGTSPSGEGQVHEHASVNNAANVNPDSGKPVMLSQQEKSVSVTEGRTPNERVERSKNIDVPPKTSSEIVGSSNVLEPQSVASNGAAAQSTQRSGQRAIEFINEHLAAGWKLYGVEPSPKADDAEWLRRVYLDVVGHIPPVDVAERFLSSRDASRREKLVESLLDDPSYVRNWTIIWTNLLIGRSDSRDVNRPALQKFLRENFARNRPWNELVAEFVSAEGNAAENGAANFLLAHMNNDAMPATAITSRVFLGRQIGCTQCHDHPFNDWKQESFWSLNSFFQQTSVAHADLRDERSGKMKARTTTLETKHVGGPTHFETRRGLMQVTYPKFEGIAVNDDADTNRRQELAKLMTSGEKPLVAESLVNRMWEHFFGCSFTRPVDDMGPHNAPSHPELLDHLAKEFVSSGYDLKQLMRWICLSDAYQRTSRFGKSNEQDDPASGAMPLFSRVYLKGMTAEQLYDSLLLATGADMTPLELGDHDRRRHEWLQQFVHAFQTDENDESVTFESSIAQALLMMNSELTEHALSLDRGTLLEKVVHSRDAEAEKLKRLCLATLTRYPTPKELQTLRKLLNSGSVAQRNNSAGWQDALWAYLNSSEFVLVH